MKDPPKRVYRLALPSEEGVQIGAWRSQPDAATSTTLVGGMRTALRTASQHRTPARLFCINSLSEARHLSTYYERGMSATQPKGKRFVRKESVPPNVALSVVAEAVSSACVLMGLPAKVRIPSPENQGHFCYVQPSLLRRRDKGCSQIMWPRFERRGSYRVS